MYKTATLVNGFLLSDRYREIFFHDKFYSLLTFEKLSLFYEGMFALIMYFVLSVLTQQMLLYCESSVAFCFKFLVK